MAIKKTTAHEIIDSQDNIWTPAMIQNGEWVNEDIDNLLKMNLIKFLFYQ